MGYFLEAQDAAGQKIKSLTVARQSKPAEYAAKLAFLSAWPGVDRVIYRRGSWTDPRRKTIRHEIVWQRPTGTIFTKWQTPDGRAPMIGI